MTNSEKKKKRDLLSLPYWSCGDIMKYFDVSKTKASKILIKLRENKDNIPDFYKEYKRPPIFVEAILQALGTTKENELDKVK